uniref:Uncharacterized protein n=1 Tax=Lygus hesperus TaxID=30085 RepID=A0A0A9X2G7_LYGHE
MPRFRIPSLPSSKVPFRLLSPFRRFHLDEEERIIRLPSENEVTDMSLMQQSITSNCYESLSQTSLNNSSDCLNFSHREREAAYLKHAEIFENWNYSDEERAFLRHRVETFSREQCIIHCILGHMLMTPDEMLGARQKGLKPDDARQALLCLAIGSHWDVYNLAIIMAFSEKLNIDSCVNRMYQGVDSAFIMSNEFRMRATLYFAKILSDE